MRRRCEKYIPWIFKTFRGGSEWFIAGWFAVHEVLKFHYGDASTKNASRKHNESTKHCTISMIASSSWNHSIYLFSGPWNIIARKIIGTDVGWITTELRFRTLTTWRHRLIHARRNNFSSRFQPPAFTTILENCNVFFATLFGVEMLLKLVAHGICEYLQDGFNAFDGFIVIVRLVFYDALCHAKLHSRMTKIICRLRRQWMRRWT